MRTITSSKYLPPVFDYSKHLWRCVRKNTNACEYMEEVKFIHREEGYRQICTSNGEVITHELSIHV